MAKCNKSIVYRCIRCRALFNSDYRGVFIARRHFGASVIGAKPICDRCAGVQRDRAGLPWFPWEDKKEYLDLSFDRQIRFTSVTRQEAFGPVKEGA